MTADELLSCLTDRPCEVCKFHTDLGCSKWSCVFEGKTEEWIPCSERLPSENGNYLVTAIWHGKLEVDMDYFQFLCQWDDYKDAVIAWMPLPKPWKENRMTIYMMTTRDKYELPLAVADSPGELAEMVGVSPERVYNGCWQSNTKRSTGKRPRKWHKVEVEDDDTLY